MKKWILMLSLLFGSAEAFAHARLMLNGSIPPRSSNAGLKTAPCGGVARGTTATTLQAGSTVTVQWEEVVNHPGRYEFYFSVVNDQNFQLLKTVEDTQNQAIVNGVSHKYSTTITVPNVICSDCTFRLVQVMTENPSNPSLYYSCADIEIVSGTVSPTPTPSATPPATGNPETCH